MDLVSILVEVLPLGLVVASIVELMATGLETARLETGRTSATAVVSEATLKGTVKTVQRSSSNLHLSRAIAFVSY